MEIFIILIEGRSEEAHILDNEYYQTSDSAIEHLLEHINEDADEEDAITASDLDGRPTDDSDYFAGYSDEENSYSVMRVSPSSK